MTSARRSFRLGFLSHVSSDGDARATLQQTTRLFQIAEELGYDSVWPSPTTVASTFGDLVADLDRSLDGEVYVTEQRAVAFQLRACCRGRRSGTTSGWAFPIAGRWSPICGSGTARPCCWSPTTSKRRLSARRTAR